MNPVFRSQLSGSMLTPEMQFGVNTGISQSFSPDLREWQSQGPGPLHVHCMDSPEKDFACFCKYKIWHMNTALDIKNFRHSFSYDALQ